MVSGGVIMAYFEIDRPVLGYDGFEQILDFIAERKAGPGAGGSIRSHFVRNMAHSN